MNCRACGTELDPGQQQVNSAVDQILETSLRDAQQTGGVCPLCGHYKSDPHRRRKRILFGAFKALLLVATAVEIYFYISRTTERATAANQALAKMNANSVVMQFLGSPIKIKSGVSGEVRQDETGWKEARLTIPVHGPNGEAVAYVVGGKGAGPWSFSSFEVLIEKQHKKIDMISGKVVEYDSAAYIRLHTQAAVPAELNNATAPAPRLDGEFPCVFASLDKSQAVPHLGKCSMPTAHAGGVDRVEADLRYGDFVLQQTDLELNDVFDVPLTRSYRSHEWASASPLHAFGLNTNHPLDIAPVGTRNPYTHLLVGLEDGDFLYFERISKGTGYADAVYQHTETSTKFYKSVISWNGDGWTLRLADGSEIRFPESYAAKNAAQGAATAILDASGNLLDLRRDPLRNLQEIRTPHGHWIRFTYDDLFRIVRAEDDAGKWTRYTYNSDGMLTDATSSSGRERHYSYQGALMTQISDERKNVLLRNWYDHSLLVRQQFGDGESYSYDYDWPQNTYCPDKVVVTSPQNATKEIRVCDSVPNFLLNFKK
jgi:YD repeat-containing protein